MLSLRSKYSSFSGFDASQYSSKNASQYITAGVCDYIPQIYFTKQLITIFIQGDDIDKMIKSVLWNQFYEKSLLKEIYFYLLAHDNSLFHVDSNFNYLLNKELKQHNSVIYFKVAGKVFNLKDKLDYSTHTNFVKQINQTKSITIQKMSKQGKWKKIVIQLGLYKIVQNYDIIFTCMTLQGKKPLSTKAESQRISKSQHTSNISNKLSRNSSGKKTPSKQRILSLKKDIVSQSKFNSNKKLKAKQNENRKNSSKKQNKNPLSYLQSSYGKSSFSNLSSGKQTKTNCQHMQDRYSIMKQTHFNNTAKVFLQQKLNFNQQNYVPSIISNQMMMKRKHKINNFNINPTQQNLNITPTQQNLQSKSNQSHKNNVVLSQIIQRKQLLILEHKQRNQQIIQKYTYEIEQLKIHHFKQTESFKTQIEKILNDYNKKYQTQKQQAKGLRLNLEQTKKSLSQIQVNLASLQGKANYLQQQNTIQKNQLKKLKFSYKNLEQKYERLLINSKSEQQQLINQKNEAIKSKQILLKKYNQLCKTLKSLTNEQQQFKF